MHEHTDGKPCPLWVSADDLFIRYVNALASLPRNEASIERTKLAWKAARKEAMATCPRGIGLRD